MSVVICRVTSSKMSLTRERFCLADFEPKLGEALLGLEAGDAGGLFDDAAAVERLGAEQLADALLPDDGVGLAAEAGAHEDVLNVAQAADLAVQQIFGVAGAEEAAGDGEFAGADRSAAELAAADLQHHVIRICRFGGSVRLQSRLRNDLRPLGFAFDDGAGLGFGDGLFGLFGAFCWRRVVSSQSVGSRFVDDDLGLVAEAGAVVDLGIDQGERDLGHAGRLAVAGAGEDDVFHLDAAQGSWRTARRAPR